MRTIVVTGSASGLGAAVAARLGDDGSRVVGVDLHDADVEADLSTADGREAAVAGIAAACDGVLDGCVVCAGLGPHVRPLSLVAAVNYFGAVGLLDALRPLLAAGEQASAVAISSNSVGLVPFEDRTLIDAMLGGDEAAARAAADGLDGPTVYAMTKYALAVGVRQRAQAWGEEGVRLNAVAPGPILTPLLQGSLDDPVLGPLVDALPVPLDRRAEPAEIAEVVAFLLSPAASFVHGAVLFADGGTDALVRPDHI